MVYLVYFTPGERVENMLYLDGFELPDSDWHVTLARFRADQTHEQGIVRDLESIAFHSFEVTTTEFAFFENDSLVVRVSNPSVLKHLHKAIEKVAAKYSALNAEFHAEFADYSAKYFRHNYLPHITVGRASSGFDQASEAARKILGQSFRVDEFYLARKQDVLGKDWSVVKAFHARH